MNKARGGGGYSQKNWVGVRGPLPKSLNLFMTKIFDFPCPFYDQTLRIMTYLWPDLNLWPDILLVTEMAAKWRQNG